jgi:hypothetical protein
MRNGGVGEGCPEGAGQFNQPVQEYAGNQSTVVIQPTTVPEVEPTPLPTPPAPNTPDAPNTQGPPPPTPGGYMPDPATGTTAPNGAGEDPDGEFIPGPTPTDTTTVNEDLADDPLVTENLPAGPG